MSEEKKFEARMPVDLVARLDAAAGRMDRSRNWMLCHAVELWMNRMDRDRERRERKRSLGA